MQKELSLLHADLVSNIFSAEHAPVKPQTQTQSQS